VTPFVLTGTIIPNAVFTAHGNVQQRRDEYIAAIRHYLGFGPVYFIENSDYPLSRDAFFIATPGLETVQYPKSNEMNRGKGYQEFEMLDTFVKNHLREDSFIKVTGRYILKNIDAITPHILKQLPDAGIVIDLMYRKKMAVVSIFAVSKSFYAQHLTEAYKEMDDLQGRWAEHVIYTRIHQSLAGVFLQPAPMIQAVTGTTGHSINMNSKGLKSWMKNTERRLFAAAGIRELLF
jgi:hypothetical protein